MSLVHTLGLLVNLLFIYLFTHILTLVPGPACSYNAMYTALKRANGISIWACGNFFKTTLSLDLDLREKIYPLVHFRGDLRHRFVIRLDELHAVFAHVRAIGNFI